MAEDRSTATIKFGKDFDAPWMVIGGSSVKELRDGLTEAMGWDASTITGNSLAELIEKATTECQAIHAARAGLGGEIVTRPARGAGKPAAASQKPEKAPSSAPDGEGGPTVESALEAAQSADDLKRVWLANKDAIAGDKALQAAFNAAKTRIVG